MSRRHEIRPERSITPNRLYTSLDEAHRGITTRVSDTPRNSAANDVDSQLDLATSGNQLLTPASIAEHRFHPHPLDESIPSGSFVGRDHPEWLLLPSKAFSRSNDKNTDEAGETSHRLNCDDVRKVTKSVTVLDSPYDGNFVKEVVKKHAVKDASDHANTEKKKATDEGSVGDDVGVSAPRETTHLSGQEGTQYTLHFAAFRDEDESPDHSVTEINDPFPDEGKYSFLRGNAEKEVSRALKKATGISQPSFGTFEYHPSAETPAVPPVPSTLSDWNSGQGYSKQKRARRGGNFYKTSAIESAWHTEDNGIKIPTSPLPNVRETSMPAAASSPAQPWSPISAENLTVLSAAAKATRADSAKNEADVAEDWETVRDEPHSDELYTAGRGPMGRVLDGSSIADFSDCLLPGEDKKSLTTVVPRFVQKGSSAYQTWWEKETGGGSRPDALRQALALRGLELERQRAMRKKKRNTTRLVNTETLANEQVDRDGSLGTNFQGIFVAQAHQTPRNWSRSEVEQLSESFENIELQDMGAENNLNKAVVDSGKNPYAWVRVRGVVNAQKARADAEGAHNIASEVGRPLSGFGTLPFAIISREDAQKIQGRRRASGLEDQSETGNYVFHHPMSSRSSNRNTMESQSRQAWTRGPTQYVPLNPSTGHMVQPSQLVQRPEPAHARLSALGGQLRTPMRISRPLPYQNPFIADSERRLPRLTIRRSQMGSAHQSVLSPHLAQRHSFFNQEDTDPELGRIAGRRALYRHKPLPSSEQLPLEAQRSLRAFFWLTIIITVPLPVFGVAVNCGMLGSTISWWTHGETRSLTSRQGKIICTLVACIMGFWVAVAVALPQLIPLSRG